MANGMYTVAKNGILNGTIDLDTDDLRALLIRTSGGGAGPYYTYSAAHATMETANVPNNADCRPETAVALASRAVSNGALDAADTTFSAATSGDAIQAIIIYKHSTGSSASDIPILYIDTTGDSSLPVTPNGGDIVISWNASGILTL